PRRGTIHEHLLRHGAPLAAVLVVPSLALGDPDGDCSTDQLLARGPLDGPGTATPVVGAWFADPLIAQGREAAARVEGRNEELAAPRRPALNDRSEERRVAKECRSRWSQYSDTKKRLRTTQGRDYSKSSRAD